MSAVPHTEVRPHVPGVDVAKSWFGGEQPGEVRFGFADLVAAAGCAGGESLAEGRGGVEVRGELGSCPGGPVTGCDELPPPVGDCAQPVEVAQRHGLDVGVEAADGDGRGAGASARLP